MTTFARANVYFCRDPGAPGEREVFPFPSLADDEENFIFSS